MLKKVTGFILSIFLLSTVLFPAMTEAATVGKTIDGMLGFSPPDGTKASANANYGQAYSADKAIDKALGTYWNSGSTKGHLELTFPQAVELNFIQVATNVRPASGQTYTVYGLVNGQWIPISPPTVASASFESPNILNPIPVDHGNYDGIKLEITAANSWVAVNEITVGINEKITLVAEGKDSSVRLDWNSVTNADEYKIEYGTESGKYTSNLTVTKDVYSNYVIPNLINGTTYYFQVKSIVNGVETIISNEAVATPKKSEEPGTENPGTEEPTTPEEPSGERALLVVTMVNGLEKEYDLSMSEVNSFIDWYDKKDAGNGPSKYAINKHKNNIGPFKNRIDYVIFNNILFFEINAYN
ncbi:fibronectin type III domain-containing protein [Paenibacillus lautus]|uniref:fibronectin type III domain-containing protein n=1 Tax=Paenibacillus lautus TaxID=1401 RepID=UPI003D28579D